MNHNILTLLALTLLAQPAVADKKPHWNNIDVIRENVEAPRAHYRFYEGREQAVISVH